MQMTVRFSLKRSGEMIGPPRMTFATAGVSADTRATYLKAINDSLDACMPLKFTGALGGALAGLDLVPGALLLVEIGVSDIAKDMRMALDHFFRHSINDFAKIEQSLLFGHLCMKNDLE